MTYLPEVSRTRFTETQKPRPHLMAGSWLVWPYRTKGSVGQFYLYGAQPLRAFLGIEHHSLPFGEAFETAALDRRMVHKNVITTILRGNKTEAFLITKPLYCTTTHIYFITLIIGNHTETLLITYSILSIKNLSRFFVLFRFFNKEYFPSLIIDASSKKGSVSFSMGLTSRSSLRQFQVKRIVSDVKNFQ
jgi:hypothetical protein